MPGTFQLWDDRILLSDSGLLAIHPDCCCTTAGTTRCCGGSDLSSRVRISIEGFRNSSCDDCSDLDGVYDADFLSSRTVYKPADGVLWPTYHWYWLGGTFSSPCWEDDLVWLVRFREVHVFTLPVTCEDGICHTGKPRCFICAWLTTPEQADKIAGGDMPPSSDPRFYFRGYPLPPPPGYEYEPPFCQGSQQSIAAWYYWPYVCRAPDSDAWGPIENAWIEQL